MTGHGGNEFLKFQDNEEISAFDIADAFEQMWEKKRFRLSLFPHWLLGLALHFGKNRLIDGAFSCSRYRYNQILFMIDTCQANTMYTKFSSPNILATGSSELDQPSYSVRLTGLTLSLSLASLPRALLGLKRDLTD
jgi:phosphatidylinositol glycan class K